MFKRILVACGMSLLSLGALAVPVTFTTSQFTTSAQATAEGVVNGNTATNPPTALPISSTATSAGPNDFANAAAVASAGLLTATVSTDSLARGASAEASSRFVGSFAGVGPFELALDLNTFQTLSGGTGAGTLLVLLTTTVGNTTTTLFNDVLTNSGSYRLQYTLASGSLSQLSLLLTDNASTTGAGQAAQSFGQVAYGATLAVPEPATWLLFGLGTGGMLLRRRFA